MHIYIMRHGDAANIAGEDSLRPLTKQGMLETKKMGQWFASSKIKMLTVFVSPFLRAQQTCDNVTDGLLKASLLSKNTIETLDFITPAGNAAQVHDFIDGFVQEKSTSELNSGQAILFVSHMPFVSYLVNELTGSENLPIFSTGAVALIDYDIKLMQGNLVNIFSPATV